MKKQPNFKANFTLCDLQKYVVKATEARGFDCETVSEKFMLLFEECGELAKAARKTQAIKPIKNQRNFTWIMNLWTSYFIF